MRVGIINRGEVAVRIIRTCQELGFTSCLFHSSPDKNTLAYELADETFELVGNSPLETYLNIEAMVDALLRKKVDLVHPGFGFLSENSEFVARLEKENLKFIGPTSASIAMVGNKISAKEIAKQAGVPTVPAYVGDTSDPKALLSEVKKIGYPCIVKAAAGGGGKGMKLVTKDSELFELVESAAREAQSAFGSAEVFIEKYVENSRHVEVQILCDQHGNAFHFYERDCSIQRRHQKIFEEAPSWSLDQHLRGQITESALKIAKACNYTSAGTVEFLVDQSGHYYFMEMNTRLQVEHTVTEMICGVDFVRLQIAIALGERLDFSQADIQPRGHAMEVRIYAENPEKDFLPSTGKILDLYLPLGPHRRFDFGVGAGHEITAFYDPMIGKIITWAPTREDNIERMLATLNDTVIFGVHTNIEFLKQVLLNLDLRENKISTGFLAKQFPKGFIPQPLTEEQKAFAKSTARVAKLQPASASLQYRSPWVGTT